MTRSFSKCFSSAALVAVLALMIGASCQAMTLLSPTPDQAVRESVKITIPASVLPSAFFEAGRPERPFIGILVGKPGAEEFVQAISASSVIRKGDNVIFYWNTKAPYRDQSNLREDKYFADGNYSLKVEVYEQAGNNAKVVSSGAVNVVLKNKVARTNPAPGVTLANSLPFGQTNEYKVRTGLQLFDTLDMPILGAIGLTGDFRVIQTVEDVRKNGEIMLRYRLDESAVTSIFGQRTALYQGQPLLPQLYRLVNRYGKVINTNMFKKQAQYTITDILPVLPQSTVKEGDSWPDSTNLKVEGLTDVLRFTGVCRLDSFEWHNGKECAKLISDLTTDGRISFNGNKIRSSSRINAKVTTYFAYKTGKMITRVIDLTFPVALEQGAGEPGGDMGAPVQTAPTSPGTPYGNDDQDTTYGNYGATGGYGAVQSTTATPTQKGKALVTVTIQLEK